MSFVELTGHAKLDRRTKDLVKRLSAEDIAIIDHTDLDRVSAEALLESGVRVVVNVASSQSGRFPNPGPLQLVGADTGSHRRSARIEITVEKGLRKLPHREPRHRHMPERHSSVPAHRDRRVQLVRLAA